jgi:hypothetical protein
MNIILALALLIVGTTTTLASLGGKTWSDGPGAFGNALRRENYTEQRLHSLISGELHV